MKTAIYARISTKEKGQDADNQLIQLREFSARQGWEIVDEYIDEMSGGTSEREQFQRMFADAADRKFDVLLFWSLDRLSRQGALATLQHLNRLSELGIAWRSYSEAYLDSTGLGLFKDAVIAILATVAAQEKLRISERTKAGLSRVRREGKTLGRPRAAVDAAKIRELRNAGLSWDKVAAQTGVPRATCQRAFSA